MPTASLIKFPVMIEAYRQAAAGQVNLDGMLTLKNEIKVPGSGLLTYHFSAGSSFPLRDAVRLMIAYSDNTATNMVLDAIGLGATGGHDGIDGLSPHQDPLQGLSPRNLHLSQSTASSSDWEVQPRWRCSRSARRCTTGVW